jgi:hypothetical protein
MAGSVRSSNRVSGCVLNYPAVNEQNSSSSSVRALGCFWGISPGSPHADHTMKTMCAEILRCAVVGVLLVLGIIAVGMAYLAFPLVPAID